MDATLPEPTHGADPDAAVDFRPVEHTGPRALDPGAKTLWRLQRIVRLALFGLPFATMVAVGIGTVAPAVVGGIVAGMLVLLQLTLLVVWPGLEYKHFRYSVREHDLLVQSGVLFRHWSSIPHARIQHVDTRQGPMERLLGLSRLQVYTAAGMSADGSIPGLAEETAEHLRDELSRRGGDDGV